LLRGPAEGFVQAGKDQVITIIMVTGTAGFVRAFSMTGTGVRAVLVVIEFLRAIAMRFAVRGKLKPEMPMDAGRQSQTSHQGQD
jgi:hypothetical protein